MIIGPQSMPAFYPLPLLGNPHLQTIFGNLLTGRHRPMRAAKRLVALADGDRVMLHETPPPLDGCASDVVLRSPSLARPADAPIAVILHGLGGNHQSGYMRRMTQRLSERGWRVFRMDLRGAGAGMRFARRFYTAACSADVHAVVQHLAATYPRAPIGVVGFSLGGNIVLRFAGECGSTALPNLRAVATIGPPIDLVRCSEMISRLRFYDAFYVRHLVRQVTEHHRWFPDLPVVAFPRRTTLRMFDDLYTAPRWGYADALDYYRQASALSGMGAIRVPTYILTARDDPFVAVQPFEELTPNPAVEVHISAHGGHLGFLGVDGIGGIRWAETQLVSWLTNMVAKRPLN